MLNHVIYGQPTDLPTLFIVHGLFGSARNWNVIAKRLSDSRQVVTVDQRNHGDSPWYDTHSYADMAGDLAQVISAIGGPVDLVGHSMGGKAAMVLALTQPGLVNRLLVADIAPVAYGHSQMDVLKAARATDLNVENRSALKIPVDDAGVAAFLAQSVDMKEKRWKLNLDVLAKDMDAILGFPSLNQTFGGPTLFLSGGASDYVLPEHRETAKTLFPAAKFAKIPDAGHWLHAEKPREFEAAVRYFMA
ncbi:alpha/beta fold hydrolase [Nereida sp. MMG025]|uniref:alpha/beta fold hydrolase n=1 Tax=Nereida sp. MMG025 TaxID=2909981 RepID=UPI001F41FAC0|nr:alpha/beta fold hydrolase [Nereida sp. MMG025]MCF6444021.1 alpha/beta fold hydrolase [Nereida sp. MMG025]